MVPTIYLGLESQGLYTVRDKLQEITNVNRQKKKDLKWWEPSKQMPIRGSEGHVGTD